MKPAIEVHHVTKEYRLGAMQSLRQLASTAGARLLGRAAERPPPFKALDDVNFSIQPGEVVGVIGHNGAGKSTLLKILSRIVTPTRGHVRVNGRVAPLIEVGAGFVGEMTGRENVYLNGAILGMSRKEIERKFDEIVDFAEMAQFIDTPVKRYSSGMQVKLAFAVATCIESEILIVDEVLAVGDLAFQRKCFDRMEDLIKRQQRTVLLVSHNIRQVERLCKRVIVMDHGCAVLDTHSQAGCNYFYSLSERQILSNADAARQKAPSRQPNQSPLNLESAKLLDAQGHEIKQLTFREPYTFRLVFRADEPILDFDVGLGIHTPDMLYLAVDDLILSPMGSQSCDAGRFSVEYQVVNNNFLPGTYAFRVGVALADADFVLYYGENLASFDVIPGTLSMTRIRGQGFFMLDGEWAINELPGADVKKTIAPGFESMTTNN